MLIVCGPSCIGKDTLVKILDEKFGWFKLRSYTTRPPRPDEGIDYIFVNDVTWEYTEDHNPFFEETHYLQEDGSIWKYGTTIAQWESMVQDPKSVAILNPSGIYQLIQMGYLLNPPLEMKDLNILYLTTDGSDEMNEELRRRYLSRGGDEKKWFTRRTQDIEDFAKFDNNIRDGKVPCNALYTYHISDTTPVERIECLAAMVDAIGIKPLVDAKEWKEKHPEYYISLGMIKGAPCSD